MLRALFKSKIFIIAAGLILSAILIRNIFGLFSVEERIRKAQNKIGGEEKRKEQLLRTQQEVTTPQFVEKQAREKLSLVRPGETVVVLPPEELLRSLAPKIEEEKNEDKPNWKKWLELFF